MLAIVPSIIFSLLFAMLAESGMVQQRCNLATDEHCLYTPVQTSQDPQHNVTKGAINWIDIDEVGAVTYIIKAGSEINFSIFCVNGGNNDFVVKFSRTGSSVAVKSDPKGKASVYFNDNVDIEARLGQTITSSTVGVDATIGCHHGK